MCSLHKEEYQVKKMHPYYYHHVVVSSPILLLCSGIDDLKLASADELIGQGHSMSTKFKTAATYGYQPVTLSNISLELFQIYMGTIRPHA